MVGFMTIKEVRKLPAQLRLIRYLLKYCQLAELGAELRLNKEDHEWTEEEQNRWEKLSDQIDPYFYALNKLEKAFLKPAEEIIGSLCRGESYLNKKIYIAGSLKNKNKVLELRDRLEECGIWLTYDWAGIIKKNEELGIKEGEKDWEDIVKKEQVGVKSAEALLFVCPGGRGSHVELGMAYVYGIPIVLIEDDNPVAFYMLPGIERFKNEDDAIKRIVELVG